MKLVGKFKLYCGESKKGGLYTALVNDLGYRKVFLTFNTMQIAEMLNLSPKEYFDLVKDMKAGDEIEV